MPPRWIEPACGWVIRTMARPMVVLPDPDSPTRPSVSPRSIVNETPSTARTQPVRLRMTPVRIGK